MAPETPLMAQLPVIASVTTTPEHHRVGRACETASRYIATPHSTPGDDAVGEAEQRLLGDQLAAAAGLTSPERDAAIVTASAWQPCCPTGPRGPAGSARG
jgi:hypothetical protein